MVRKKTIESSLLEDEDVSNVHLPSGLLLDGLRNTMGSYDDGIKLDRMEMFHQTAEAIHAQANK